MRVGSFFKHDQSCYIKETLPNTYARTPKDGLSHSGSSGVTQTEGVGVTHTVLEVVSRVLSKRWDLIPCGGFDWGTVSGYLCKTATCELHARRWLCAKPQTVAQHHKIVWGNRAKRKRNMDFFSKGQVLFLVMLCVL